MTAAEFQAWALSYLPWAGLALYVFFSALGHVRMSPEQARAYPRLFSAILFGQAIGMWVTRAIYPLLGMFAPQRAMALVDKVFPPPTPPDPPSPDPAAIPVVVDVPPAEPTQPSSPPPDRLDSTGGRRA